MTDHITRLKEALEASLSARDYDSDLGGAGEYSKLLDAFTEVVTPLLEGLDREAAARRQAQEENVDLKARLASQRVELMRELREQMEQAEKERDELKAEVHNLNWALGTPGYEQMATPEQQVEADAAVARTDEFIARLAEGKAKYDAMEKDARRYRVIRNREHGFVLEQDRPGWRDTIPWMQGTDAAIDAAIASQEGGQNEPQA